MESFGKSEIKSFTGPGQRSEIPADRFKIPGNNISDVKVEGSTIKIYDETGKKTPHDLSTHTIGEYRGHGNDFVVGKKGGLLYGTWDLKGNPIKTGFSASAIGELRSASSSTMTFEKSGWIKTYDKTFRPIGNPRHV
jgi:hypothetical protein